jgi:hypothetical protein
LSEQPPLLKYDLVRSCLLRKRPACSEEVSFPVHVTVEETLYTGNPLSQKLRNLPSPIKRIRFRGHVLPERPLELQGRPLYCGNFIVGVEFFEAHPDDVAVSDEA